MRRFLAACAAAITLTLAVPALATPARAAAGPVWFVKGQDVQPDNNAGVQSAGLAAQAAKDGVTLPPLVQGCGVWQDHTVGRSDYTACAAGGVPIVEDYTQLTTLHDAGYRGTVMYDCEPWSYTPAAQAADPVGSVRTAAGLARSYGMRLISTFGGTGGRGLDTLANYEAAIKAGVPEISMQTQGARFGGMYSNGTFTVSKWKTEVRYWVSSARATARAAGRNTMIMLGLATNTNIPIPVWVARREYSYGTSLGIRHWWENSNNWGGKNLCTAAQGGPGCPEAGVRFLANP